MEFFFGRILKILRAERLLQGSIIQQLPHHMYEMAIELIKFLEIVEQAAVFLYKPMDANGLVYARHFANYFAQCNFHGLASNEEQPGELLSNCFHDI